MSLVAQSRYFVRSAFQGLYHSPFVSLISVLTIAIALFTAGLVRASAEYLDELVGSLGQEVELTVYLAQGLSRDQVNQVRAQVEELSLGKAEVVDQQTALTRLTTELGPLGSALADLPENPLPTSIEVSLPRTRRTPEVLKALSERLKQVAGVAEVDYGERAVEQLSSLAKGLKLGGGIALAVIALGAVMIVAATFQLAVHSRKEEIEIQKLVGATDRFVQAPFLLEGAIQGLAGAVLAGLGLLFFFALLMPTVGQAISFLQGPGLPSPISMGFAAQLALIGAGLGLCSSLIAVGRFSRR